MRTTPSLLSARRIEVGDTSEPCPPALAPYFRSIEPASGPMSLWLRPIATEGAPVGETGSSTVVAELLRRP